jgi:hypothetical protein
MDSSTSAIASPRGGTEIAFAVDADAHGVGVHVVPADHEHGVDFHLFGALDLAVDLVGAFIDFRANLISAQFVQNRTRVVDQSWFVAYCEVRTCSGASQSGKWPA